MYIIMHTWRLRLIDLMIFSLHALYDKNSIVILYENKIYVIVNNRLYDTKIENNLMYQLSIAFV